MRLKARENSSVSNNNRTESHKLEKEKPDVWQPPSYYIWAIWARMHLRRRHTCTTSVVAHVILYGVFPSHHQFWVWRVDDIKGKMWLTCQIYCISCLYTSQHTIDYLSNEPQDEHRSKMHTTCGGLKLNVGSVHCIFVLHDMSMSKIFTKFKCPKLAKTCFK